MGSALRRQHWIILPPQGLEASRTDDHTPPPRPPFYVDQVQATAVLLSWGRFMKNLDSGPSQQQPREGGREAIRAGGRA